MAGVWSINNLYNSNFKRVSSKLTFQMGESFSAKIVSSDEEAGELLLKLKDGWQFPAKIEKPLNFNLGELLRFQVIGFEEGKLKIKLLSAGENKDSPGENSIENIMLENDMNSGEYLLLEKMVKYNIPLTKENISKVKNLADFIDKIKSEPHNEEEFISKYLISKGLDSNSSGGKTAQRLLKDFFGELKKLSVEDLLLFTNNGIEFTTENIQSYNKLVKGSAVMYKDIKIIEKQMDLMHIDEISSEIEDLIFEISGKKLMVEQEKVENLYRLIKDNSSTNEADSGSKRSGSVISSKNAEINDLRNIIKEIAGSETELGAPALDLIIKRVTGKINRIDETVKELAKDHEAIVNPDSRGEDIADKIAKIPNKNIVLSPSQNYSDINGAPVKKVSIIDLLKEISMEEHSIPDGDSNSVHADGQEQTTLSEGEIQVQIKDKQLKHLPKESAELVKEQIASKTEEVKSIIRDIMAKINDSKPEINEKFVELMRNNINDFKIFNSLSNQYYYMDLPLELKDREYPCKLIVKDERKKGKKIDSKNVKMVVSVKTVNLGEVDGYIKVRDSNMSVDIKCAEEWVGILEMAKEKLIGNLSGIGYSVQIDITKKEEEINITNCSEFFEDKSLSNINIKV